MLEFRTEAPSICKHNLELDLASNSDKNLTNFAKAGILITAVSLRMKIELMDNVKRIKCRMINTLHNTL